MTDTEILTKAIQRAQDTNWMPNTKCRILEVPGYDGPMVEWKWGDGSTRYEYYTFFIFNHQFAKALWGEQHVYVIGGSEPGERAALLYPTLERYKYHLQQLVIADDPIKYLGEHLDDR